jgi:nitroreductase
MQPWYFVVVSDPSVKKKIRVAAEEVEADFYGRRAPQYWLDALAPLGTDEHKEYLEIAPYLIAIFQQRHTVDKDGAVHKHYYITESVGIATGILITALHNAGLACLTHTPNPMAFLRTVLDRPKSETPFLLLAVGYPDSDGTVPDISKKPLDQISTFV